MNLSLVLREALQGVRRTGIAGVISVAIIGTSLLILGFFWQVIESGNALAGRLRARVEIDIYLKDGLSPQRVLALRRTLEARPEVGGIVYVDQDAATKEFRSLFGFGVVDELSRNPLPASLRVLITPGENMPRRARAVARAITGHSAVEGVNVGEVWVDSLEHFIVVTTSIGLVLGCTMCFACAFAVSHTTKLMVLAQRNAIEIMRLVGATNRTIQMIFGTGGAILGFVGGILAPMILAYIAPWWAVRVPDLTVTPTIELTFCLVVLGTLLGVIGSWASLNRVLREIA
jgi:cell division transport system permease protein